jgi:hypothetical protein
MDAFFYHIWRAPVYLRPQPIRPTPSTTAGRPRRRLCAPTCWRDLENTAGQAAIDLGNSAHCGAPYDMSLRRRWPASAVASQCALLARREGLTLRAPDDIRARIGHLEDLDSDADTTLAGGRRRRSGRAAHQTYSIKYNGIKHQEAIGR